MKIAPCILRLKTLDSVFIPFDNKKPLWYGADKRYPDAPVRRFISANRASFAFLGIRAEAMEEGGRQGVKLASSNFIGVVPLFSPISGKKGGTLVVEGRYGEDNEILQYVVDDVDIVFEPNYTITDSVDLGAPLFLECCKYVDKFLEARKAGWHKFDNVKEIERMPRSSTIWTEYARRCSLSPHSALQFPNKHNILNTDHREWRMLCAVADYAASVIGRHTTPRSVRAHYSRRLDVLRQYLQNHPQLASSSISVHASDPAVIKDLKRIAANVLSGKTDRQVAWRLDYAQLFERYVQFLVKTVVSQQGGSVTSNARYSIEARGTRPAWALAYLEPDIVYRRDDAETVIDAKYKSHMLNLGTASDDLKDAFRHDLHQCLAYSSFSPGACRRIMLVYPATQLVWRQMQIRSPFSDIRAVVTLAGIPLKKEELRATVDFLAGRLA